MKITILNIANKAPSWVQDATNEYLKRINHGKYSCKIVEIKSDKISNKPVSEIMDLEARKFERHIPKDSFVVALDERGKLFDSIEFAKYLESTALTFRNITFIIGGANGIDSTLRQKCHTSISLSKMVFPHMLVRIIMLEQIYRAISILENHPYHRE